MPGKTPSKIGSIQSRCNELKARTKENTLRHSRLGQRRNSGQWQSPTYLGQESKPLLSLDYTEKTHLIRCPALETRESDFMSSPKDNDGKTEILGSSPKDKYGKPKILEEMEKTHLIRCLAEEMVMTHLIRCPALKTTADPPDSVSSSKDKDPPDSVSSPKDNDGKPDILKSKKTANELLYMYPPPMEKAEVKVVIALFRPIEIQQIINLERSKKRAKERQLRLERERIASVVRREKLLKLSAGQTPTQRRGAHSR
ncbi:unnamed protein product [Rodentolepis nana]|uniref:Uncharacterized protein n=1 Tax=Rodentolepis nana TaxID=102285 RepID=A0A3P7VGM4_RODNA|nr:unnamed protein product [Rodentolepis nana]